VRTPPEALGQLAAYPRASSLTLLKRAVPRVGAPLFFCYRAGLLSGRLLLLLLRLLLLGQQLGR
jgi:hypothetical protein